MDNAITGPEPNDDPGDVRTDLPNQRTGDHMPEGGVRDEDDDLSSTPID